MGSSKAENKATATMGRMKYALGFSGKIKSGKTTIARRVAESFNVPFASFGDYLRSVADGRGFDSSDRLVLQEIGQELFEKNLTTFCCNVLLSAGWKKGKYFVIDGIRHVDVLTELQRIVAPVPLKLIYINIAGELQANRFKKSGSRHSLDTVESHATEVDVVDALKQLAQLQLDGSVPIEDLLQKLVLASGSDSW